MLGVAGAASLVDCVDTADSEPETTKRSTPPARETYPKIQGYAWPPSVGYTLTLYVSTRAPQFVVEVYGLRGPRRLALLGPFDGVSAPRGTPVSTWEWARYDVPIDLPSGVYTAVLRGCDAAGALLDAEPQLATTTGEAKVLFVVRSTATAPILYKLPLFTYHAYNEAGGGCLYGVWEHVQVALRRPGGGTGHTDVGHDMGQIFVDGLTDPFGSTHDLQWNTFEHWDAKMIRWLYAHGHELDFCTDWDLHTDPGLLGPYRLLVNAGHDEYWSTAMRDHVEAFLDAGGNVAWFGGNTCFWHVEVDVDHPAVHCNKVNNYADHWNLLGRPENSMTGMSMRAGGYNAHVREPLGYTIVDLASWVFAGVEATSFGESHALIGYEVDGAPVDASLQLTYADDTPPNFQVLARAVLPPGNPSPDGWMTPSPPQPGVAMIGLFTRTGTVFNAGVTDWARVLAEGDVATARITKNVIDRLSTRRVTVALGDPIANVPDPIAPPDAVQALFIEPIVAFADCGTCLVVAVADGNLYELVRTDGGFRRDVLPYFGVNRQSTVVALVPISDGVAVIVNDGRTVELSWSAA
jgi:hypothetical protein